MYGQKVPPLAHLQFAVGICPFVLLDLSRQVSENFFDFVGPVLIFVPDHFLLLSLVFSFLHYLWANLLVSSKPLRLILQYFCFCICFKYVHLML